MNSRRGNRNLDRTHRISVSCSYAHAGAMADRELRARPVGHRKPSLLRLVRLIPAAGGIRPGQENWTASGPVSASRAWNNHAESGSVACRAWAFT